MVQGLEKSSSGPALVAAPRPAIHGCLQCSSILSSIMAVEHRWSRKNRLPMSTEKVVFGIPLPCASLQSVHTA